MIEVVAQQYSISVEVVTPTVEVQQTPVTVEVTGSAGNTEIIAQVVSVEVQAVAMPELIEVSDASVVEGDNSISGFSDKTLIKWLRVQTASTDWTLTLFSSDNYASDPFIIVDHRSGNMDVFLDLPWADKDSSGELHYNFTDNSGMGETHDIQVLATSLR